MLNVKSISEICGQKEEREKKNSNINNNNNKYDTLDMMVFLLHLSEETNLYKKKTECYLQVKKLKTEKGLNLS